MLADIMAVDTGVDIGIVDTRRYKPLQKNTMRKSSAVIKRKINCGRKELFL